MDEPPEPEEAAESEEASRGEDPSDEDVASRGTEASEDEASKGANPSRGSASSSRSAPVEADLQVLSSSDEEDAFRVARSRRVEEDEEEEPSGGRGGRSEPRSKAVHDRSAATARGAPREETRAPQREAGASNTQPPKAKKRVWVMGDE